VSPRPHIQPEEEDPVNEGIEDEGRSGREGESDEHFNNIRSVIPTKQEWRVKEKPNTHAPTTFDDDMGLLDDDDALLIKDGSPSSTSMIF
jgi:hypothetical protein